MIEVAATFAFFCAGLACLGLAARFFKQAWAEEAVVRLKAIAVDSDIARQNAELNARLQALARLTGAASKPTPPQPPTPPKGRKPPPLFKLVKDGDSKSD